MEKNFDFKTVLFFDSMLTPKIITFVYWLFLALAALSGVGSILAGLASIFGGKFIVGISTMIMGLIGMVLGAAFARIWCEILIVVFRINDNVQKIADK